MCTIEPRVSVRNEKLLHMRTSELTLYPEIRATTQAATVPSHTFQAEVNLAQQNTFRLKTLDDSNCVCSG